jgi:N-acetylglucosaminyl-diphospho-decaprenol L-rhamnosyltransferase
LPAVPGVATVVVSHNSAAHLPALLSAMLDQTGPGDELIVVDNLSCDGSAAVARAAGDRVTVIETGANLGFGGGCHVGADATDAPLLFFLNPDSVPEPGCLDRLRNAAAAHPTWGAWQAVVLMDGGDRINTDGGIVHFTGIGWAGHCGEPVSSLRRAPSTAGFPSGAALMIRRELWTALGGFEADYFLYCEDLDLGLRLWLAGHEVGVVPDAHVVHSYDFDKGAAKWFYLERNRLRTVLSVYPPTLLALLTPALLGLEVALLVVAGRQGWVGAKLRADLAVLGELPAIRRRRRRVQTSRRRGERSFARLLTASLDNEYIGVDPAGLAARLQAGYWSLVLGLLRLGGA